MDDQNGVNSLPSRKRLRRDAKSCVECRRRKVKCSLATEDAPACSECVKRGIQCITTSSDREYANDWHPPPVSSLSSEDRLERIERLLARLCDGQKDLKSQIGAAISASVTEPTSQRDTAIQDQIENSPLLHLLRDGISAHSEALTSSATQQHSPVVPNSNRRSRQATRQSSWKRFLISLLPSHQDATLIAENTNAWALNLDNTPGAMPNPKERFSFLDYNATSHCKVTTIGQTLLYLALSIQQLPPDFNMSLLEMDDPKSKIESYIANVNCLILADEELACSTEGVECLLLLGMIYINDGVLQKAWMTFRRALDVARLLGLHKSYSSSARESGSKEDIAKRRMWFSVVIGDAHVSLLLGLEPGAGSEPFGPGETWGDPFADPDTNFQRRLSFIAGRISRRNLYLMDQGYGPTEALDEALDGLQKCMPESWWEIPVLNNERSLESASKLDRLLSHFWFFQLRAFTHLPYIFRASKEKKFEYSRSTCLDSSRAILHRYLILRRVENTQLHCRVVDFGAFVAAVTILLLLIQDPNSGKTLDWRSIPDTVLVEQVIRSMDILAKSSKREVVAKQSVGVLTKLLALRNSPSMEPRNLQLTVPHFGTITISPPRSLQRGDIESPSSAAATPGSLAMGNAISGSSGLTARPAFGYSSQYPSVLNDPSPPFNLAFSNTQFSSPGTPTPQLPASQESDTVVFDSLWDTDILNWDWNS
ncbi:hypothetical protein K469DRAFT_141827 [Zopfia rhizophila CBS 207.26]|uniref:Zn(2)-C6 fungal-type domain-containing protein n=1 Tax=Zopfia rhizophila CBS 207.26 TaxID=1314779 RepID=A0A6A6E7W9_9PEZI|nr:hypothetical protein K469DRAFT_141827 [Zopfia rhizophila CBS 207.26]